MSQKFGYVAISGPTNSGKSTLLNTIFEKKVSIVSHKVQTTLRSMDVVKNYNNTQMVFIDTPGFYEKKNNANYLKDVLASIQRSDLLLIILDVTSKFIYLEQIQKIIQQYDKKKFLIINKIDLVDNEYILKKIREISFIESFNEIFEIVDKHNDENLSGIFHCFTGNLDQAQKIIDFKNFKMGIGGVLTFKKSGLDKVVEQIDLNHLVLETDSPYLAPTPYRGKRNQSNYIPIIAQKLAEVKGVSIETVAEVTTKNALEIFKMNEN